MKASTYTHGASRPDLDLRGPGSKKYCTAGDATSTRSKSGWPVQHRRLAREGFGLRWLVALDAVDGRGVYRPVGRVSAGQAADMITAALDLARSGGLHAVLIDITRMSGFEVPGPAFRRWAVRRWAGASDGIRVAMIARREHICPEKVGLLVAAEEEMRAHITASEADAIAWLNGGVDWDA